MAAHALIFDLDGTVWDSADWFASGLVADDRPDGRRSVRDALVGGGNVIAALNRAGISRERMLRDALARSGPPPLFPGMAEAFTAARDRGVALGVATSLPGTVALPMIEAAGIGTFFPVVIHAGVCRTAKPHPRSLLMAAEGLGVTPGADIFYVGDREVDATAAERAGMGSVWMTHGYGRPGAASIAMGPAGLLRL